MAMNRIKQAGAWPFSPYVLVVLFHPLTLLDAQETVNRARAAASRPALLRFAVPDEFDSQLDAGDSMLLFYAGREPLIAAASLVTDERYFLLISGPHDFSSRWDASLAATLRSLEEHPTILTASITPGAHEPTAASEAPTIRAPKVSPNAFHTLRQSLPEIRRRRLKGSGEAPVVHPPEVCLPALKDRIGDREVEIGYGLPLCQSAGPITTLVIDPAFVFGPVDFLWDNDLTLSTLSLASYLSGWRNCVIDLPLLWPMCDLPRRVLRLPDAGVLPGTTLSRFEQLLGLHSDQSMACAKGRLGLYGTADTYDQRMPASIRLSQKAREARQHLLETHMPLMVSAFIDFPAPRFPIPFYTLRFGFLRRIQSLPLVLYTGGSQERQLRASFPHTQSYPDNSLLPRTLLQEGMTVQQHFARSKPLLLSRAVRKQVEFTHVAWLDMDVLPHPICPDVMPSFEPLMDDRIHLATVGGVPDASFVLMPSRLAPAVAREAQSITLLDAELKRGFSEELLWERLFAKKPEWFTIHPMPRRRLLFLTVFDSRLLSQAIRPLIANLPEPFEGTAADRRRASIKSSKEPIK